MVWQGQLEHGGEQGPLDNRFGGPHVAGLHPLLHMTFGTSCWESQMICCHLWILDDHLMWEWRECPFFVFMADLPRTPLSHSSICQSLSRFLTPSLFWSLTLSLCWWSLSKALCAPLLYPVLLQFNHYIVALHRVEVVHYGYTCLAQSNNRDLLLTASSVKFLLLW